ncbi:McrB family protein [Halostagnicola sp. A56]|uniref:McrB family protein n=1 Tax=Halostagnicola sp. A56 TaxID=1495067 RepID=UPI000679580A|nr:AAA family ATPase [Halostagnicola sp. A56]
MGKFVWRAALDKKPRETETIERQLQNTGQLVFYGPPGTGKTYTAQRFARWWLNQQPGHAPSSNQLETVTFHPSFSYEDFLEGLTAEADEGAVEYNIKDGVFKRICNRAEQAYHHAQQNEDVDEPPRFVLIIDEINRGNLAQIFGETITLLEADKRLGEEDEVEITLAHSGESFALILLSTKSLHCIQYAYFSLYYVSPADLASPNRAPHSPLTSTLEWNKFVVHVSIADPVLVSRPPFTGSCTVGHCE